VFIFYNTSGTHCPYAFYFLQVFVCGRIDRLFDKFFFDGLGAKGFPWGRKFNWCLRRWTMLSSSPVIS
ncbi:MAG: hypothetical protein VW892_04525, partial [Flavobacteriaceae bacterium]